jgi:Na+/H+ antiporter NhaD/arsenite permease-like protein
VFFAGLFVMVGSLVATGVMEEISRAATEATEGRLFFASMVLPWGSAVLSAVVDNIPYVATMSPVVAEMVHANGNTEGGVPVDSASVTCRASGPAARRA